MQQPVKVYGADWCPKTQRTLAYLRELGTPHEYVDVEKNAHASEWVKSQNDGKEVKPTVDVEGRILSEPSNEALAEALGGLQSAYMRDVPPG